MRIKNKKTQQDQEVSEDTWSQMQDKGLSARFKILNKDSAPVVEKPAAAIPEEVKKLRNRKAETKK